MLAPDGGVLGDVLARLDPHAGLRRVALCWVLLCSLLWFRFLRGGGAASPPRSRAAASRCDALIRPPTADGSRTAAAVAAPVARKTARCVVAPQVLQVPGVVIASLFVISAYDIAAFVLEEARLVLFRFDAPVQRGGATCVRVFSRWPAGVTNNVRDARRLSLATGAAADRRHVRLAAPPEPAARARRRRVPDLGDHLVHHELGHLQGPAGRGL